MSEEDIQPGYQLVPGSGASSVILHVPHASRRLTPAARAQIVLDDAALSAELDRMTDAHTDLIASGAARSARSTPWLFINRYSRLVVDPERFPDEREEMLAVGMGAVYTRTSHGEQLRPDNDRHRDDLLARHFRPYAKAMTTLVDDRLAATGRAVIIDVHSYPTMALPYELHSAGPRPEICLGTDPGHTPSAITDAALLAFAATGTVALDTPFSGCYVPLKHYQHQRAVSALMVEIRRDTYLTEPTGPPNEGINRLVEALSRLIDHLATIR
jgi:N-formylglutamate amidohydrolase